MRSQMNCTLRSCFIGTNQVGLVEFLGFFIGNQPFSVGLVDQLFQPTRNPVELVENDWYRRTAITIVGSYLLHNAFNKHHLV